MGRWVAGLAVVVLLSWCGLGRGQEAGGAIELGIKGYAFAMNPRTGGVAAIDPSAGTVVLFPKLGSAGSAEGAVTRRASSVPSSIVHKAVGDKGYFVVACAGDGQLMVLDDVTLGMVKTVPAVGETPMSLTAPRAGDQPYVYYSVNAGSVPWGHQVGRLDLRTMEGFGPVRMQQDMEEIAVSADGGMMYARRPGTSPSGYIACRVLPSTEGGGKGFELAQVTYIHEDSRPFVTDAFGQCVASGKQIWSVGLKSKLAEVAAGVLCFPERPAVALGVGPGAKLTAYSVNDYREVGSVELPAEVVGEADASGRGRRRVGNGEEEVRIAGRAVRYGPAVMVDEKGERVVVCCKGEAAVVGVSGMKLPDEPVLAATVTGPGAVAMGEAGRWTVTKADPRVTVALEGAPAGMKLGADGVIEWTPGSGDVGVKTVGVRISAGGASRRQALEVMVRRPGVELGFAVARVSVEPVEGKWAVVLGVPGSGSGGGRVAPGGQAGGLPDTHVAVLDVEKRAVGADRVVPGIFNVASIDDQYVYLAAQDSDSFLVLKRSDLSEVRRVFTTKRATQIAAVAGRAVYVATEQGPVTAYSTKDLAPMEPADGQQQRGSMPWGGRVPQWVGVGWYYEGVLYDRLFEKALMLVSPPGFAQGRGMGEVQRGYDPSGRPPVAPWGTYATGTRLHRESGQTIGTVPGNTAEVLEDVPLAVGLKWGDTPNGENVSAALEVMGLSGEGQEAEPVVLFDEPRTTQRGLPSYGGGGQALLAQAGGTVLAVVQDRVFMVSTKELAAGRKLVEPVHLEPRQPVMAIAATGETKIDLKWSGGTAPLRFAPLMASPAFSVDAGSGAVTVTPTVGVVMDKLVEAVKQAAQGRYDPTTHALLSPEAGLAAYQAEAGARFEKLTGHKAAGLPVALSVSVDCRDANQQQALADFVVLVDLPTAAVMQQVKAEAARREQLQDQRQAMMRQQQAEAARRMAATGQAVGADVAVLRQRLAEAERRNAQLEAQVELLKQMVREQQGGGAATRP